MLVQAIKPGFGGSPPARRLVGDEFEMPQGSKGSWFAPVITQGEAPKQADTKAKGRKLEADPTDLV
jgi:hypothetical protein